jgi:hypothetical protein
LEKVVAGKKDEFQQAEWGFLGSKTKEGEARPKREEKGPQRKMKID